MVAKVRRSIGTSDDGFTLVELLLIIVIVGILAAIAIPVLLSQRNKATEASMKSDLRTVANQMETYFVDHHVYPAVPASQGSVLIDGKPVRLSGRNSAEVTPAVVGGLPSFCVAVTNPDVGGGDADSGWYFDSAKGGIQPQGEGCG
jgi:prepilin-type N-terminal cleavage/methylation domain-containing protein